MLSVTLFTRVHPAFNKMPGVFIRALLTQVTEDILKITILSEWMSQSKFIVCRPHHVLEDELEILLVRGPLGK